MLKRVRIERDEEGVRATLPQEMLDRLDIGENEELSAVETDRGILLTRDESVGQTLNLFQRVREKFDRALRELAR